nr:uncharacterized protein LOC111502375 isoform X2 [Leptinotarsa decemlineata]
MPQNGSDNEAPTKEKEAHQNDSLPARSLKQKLVTIKKAVTVEPVVGFYYMAVYLCKPALANLEIEKACRVNLQYNDSICDTIVEGQHKNYSAFNHEIQVTISEMHSWQQPVQSFMPLILILFLGSYSDRHKWRKPFIILPIVGEVLGETNLLYLYVQNVFQWTPVEFSFFITVNGLVLLIGNSLALPLFTKILRISDHMILFVCILTKIFSNVAFGLATTSLTFYIGSSVSVITRMYRVAKKSLSTKIVAEKDIGKFQSVIGICEAIAPALAVPVYNSIYIQTLDTFPAAVFFFSILLYAVCSVLVLLMTCLVKRGCEEKGMGVTMNKKSDYDDNIIETVHL